MINRLETDRLSAEDRRLLVKLIQLYFWLTCALRETKLSLKRLKVALFGKGSTDTGPKKGRPPNDDGGSLGTGAGSAPGQGGLGSVPEKPDAEDRPDETGPAERRRGHGRRGAQAYWGAEQVVCRHEDLAAGQRCPVCGRGTLYRLPSGVEIRIDGNALLSAVRYELEKLRCSACGEVFTAPLPEAVGREAYTPQARAVRALSRYYLGLPFYRLERYQALLGVPVADATQWDQVERVADCAYPVFEHLKCLAAQGEVIYQDDTHVRILALMAEHRQDLNRERTGMYTTGLVVQHGARIICLYASGRAHAGENLSELLNLREADREKPVVMSDASAANGLNDEAAVIRSHCLAHGQRQFTEIDEVFPEECTRVISDLNKVFKHEARTRDQAMTATERLAYHPAHSGPIFHDLNAWLERQFTERRVEPASSLGKAFNYLLNHWPELTQFLRVPGAPLDNNTVERALKLMIRQRKNSLFYARPHSAYVASLLTRLIATCAQAGVNGLAYLVALQAHRSQIFQNPEAWLPWNYTESRAPSEATRRQSSAMWAWSGWPFHSKIESARAAKETLAPSVRGHHWKRPVDRRLVHNQ